MLTLTYKYKAMPTAEQIDLIEYTLTVCRKVWNFALRERKDWINARKCPVNACSIVSEYITPADAPYPNSAQQCKSLTVAKDQVSALKTVNAQVLRQVLRKPETAFVDMSRQGMGFPRFKNKARLRWFVYPQLGKAQFLKGNPIKLPQLGWMEYVKSREIPDGFVVKQVRVVRKASGYFLMLTLEADENVADPVLFGHPPSQVCPQCDTQTGKKDLSDRLHACPACGYTTHGAVAAAQVIRDRGISALGSRVEQIACGDGLTGTGNSLVKSQRSRKKGGEARQQSLPRNIF
jgi:transposase